MIHQSSSVYWFVEMGPIPGKPAWHQAMYEHSSYPFPTEAAAQRFAANHQALDPLREISIRKGE